MLFPQYKPIPIEGERRPNPELPRGLIVFGLAAAAGIAIWALSTDAFAASKKKLGPGTGGTGPSLPPGVPKVPPKSGPGGGTEWGDAPQDAKDGFDWNSAGIWVSDDCNTVLEGARFWGPEPDSFMATTPSAALNAPDPGIIHFINGARYAFRINDPDTISDLIINDLVPHCYSVSRENWGVGLWNWYVSLVQRITRYITNHPFVPSESTVYFYTKPAHAIVEQLAKQMVRDAGLSVANATPGQLAPYSPSTEATIKSQELNWFAVAPDPNVTSSWSVSVAVPQGDDPGDYAIEDAVRNDLIPFAQTGQ